MKILITGANGLVGQKLKNEILRRNNMQLIATSQSPETNILKQEYIFETLDITNKTETAYLLERYKPDVLINTAAQANANACEKNRSHCWQVNTEAVKHLTRISNQLDIHFIHFSTDFVFSGKQPVYHEEDTPEPVNFYGTCKKEAEAFITAHANKWSIIRTILVYGYVPQMKRNNLVTWIYESLKQGKPLNIVNDQFRAPTFGEDLARATLEIAGKGRTGIFHISGKEVMSIYEMALKIAEHFILDKNLLTPVPSAALDEPAQRPPHTRFDLYKAEKELNFFPHSFKESLDIIEKQIYKQQ
jgi:dTDP-4-dehydrorhamnose reductase